jgi:hypothetical protein
MDTKSAISSLGALAQETRLAIFRMLVEASAQGLVAGTIAEQRAEAKDKAMAAGCRGAAPAPVSSETAATCCG